MLTSNNQENFEREQRHARGKKTYTVDGVTLEILLGKAKELTQGARLAPSFFVVSDRSSITTVSSDVD